MRTRQRQSPHPFFASFPSRENFFPCLASVMGHHCLKPISFLCWAQTFLELVSTDKDSIIASYKIATTRMCYLAQDQESRSVGNNRDPNHTKQFNDNQINGNNNRKRNLITVSDN